MKEKLIEIYNPADMKKFVRDNNYLLVDDGIEEFIIKEEDLPDYIYNRNQNIEVFKPDGTFLLSTFGFFLNKIAYEERQKIIERLIKLQLGDIESKKTYYCDSVILQYMED